MQLASMQVTVGVAYVSKQVLIKARYKH
jgi:hypothetical protein